MLWCFPLVPLCNTSWPLMWRGLTSHPGPCPSVLLICHFTSHPPYNENQLFAALPHTHHLCFMPLCLCPSYSFQSLSLHSAFPFNLLEPISWHALHQLLHDCTPSLDEESSKLPKHFCSFIFSICTALCSQQVFCVLSWPVHEFLEGKYCVYFIYILSVPRTALGKY